jgi:hypothetical protein
LICNIFKSHGAIPSTIHYIIGDSHRNWSIE